jgi:hypothetical protein
MTELSTAVPAAVAQGEVGVQAKPEWATWVPKEGRCGSIIQGYIDLARNQVRFQEGLEVNKLQFLKGEVDWDRVASLSLSDGDPRLDTFREVRYLLSRMYVVDDSGGFEPYSSLDEANNGIARVIELLNPYKKI